MPLAEQVIQSSAQAPGPHVAGRRLRVFARLVRCSQAAQAYAGFGYVADADQPGQPYRLVLYGGHVLCDLAERPTYAGALALCQADPALADVLRHLPLRTGGSTPRQLHSLAEVLDQIAGPLLSMNPSLWDVLQDLADEIAIDVHEACAAFADPYVWYAGVDEGIEPVPDEHVALVIAALQRELNRERRNAAGGNFEPRLPAAPLALLPWRVQRALVERRRLRYQQWGIGLTEWESGHWSLWNVPEDADWTPRQVTDGRTAFGVVG